MIDGKKCFDVIITKKEEAYENLLNWVKIMITQLVIYWINDLNNSDLKKQINFIGKCENDRPIMFFITEKSEETTSEFSQNSVSIN